jgi:hypothetical protein
MGSAVTTGGGPLPFGIVLHAASKVTDAKISSFLNWPAKACGRALVAAMVALILCSLGRSF